MSSAAASASSLVTVKGAKVIVVGGGLAGLSAAHSVLERGGRVLVIDKKEFLGGNSVKATSGINGALTTTQQQLKIQDSVEAFLKDTAVSASGLAADQSAVASPLNRVLVEESGPAVEWLKSYFDLDLSLVSRLGGHSFPRTHRGKERFPGMTITYALMEKFDDISKKSPELAQVVTLARVTRLVTDGTGAVVGVEFEKNGVLYQETGPVIISTGGFAADFSKDSLLAKYRPDLLHLPTTNGDHCTGDGLKMAMAIGGSTVDMTAVQVHPTGLVHPDQPDSKVKFLAAEALRGVGGLMLDKNGLRFCNELGRRDYCTGEMWKRNAGPYRLLLNAAASKEIEWHCKHYRGRGLMKRFDNGTELAKEFGVAPEVLKKTFDDYNEVAANGNDPFGKKYFHNAPFTMGEHYYVAIITPVNHYTMGGIQIDTNSNIVRADGTPIQGLYAAGEVAGGVHGKNRLGGSGLLGCVVFGRVSGSKAASYLLSNLSKPDSSASTAARRLGAVTRQLQIIINVDTDKGTISTSTEQAAPASAPAAAAAAAPAAAAPAAAAPAAAPAAAAANTDTEYSLDDVAKHNTDKDCWVVVNGQVLNVTTFLDRHPGGKGSIMLFAGRDASEEFNMLHKPDVIAKFAPEVVIGKLKK